MKFADLKVYGNLKYIIYLLRNPFEWYTPEPSDEYQAGYSMLCYEKVVHNYFIPCHRKKLPSVQHMIETVLATHTNTYCLSCFVIGCDFYGIVIYIGTMHRGVPLH